jgi:hypothetical protein
VGELESLIDEYAKVDPRTLTKRELSEQIIELCELHRLLREYRAELAGVDARRKAAQGSGA